MKAKYIKRIILLQTILFSFTSFSQCDVELCYSSEEIGDSTVFTGSWPGGFEPDTFWWGYGAGSIETSDDSTITVLTTDLASPGYFVCFGAYSVAEGCYPDTICTPCVLGSQETNTIDQSSILLFPSPSSDVLHVSFGPIHQTGEISIYNSLGQLVLRHEILEEKETTLSVSEFAKGLYYLNFSDPETQILISKKFTVE